VTDASTRPAVVVEELFTARFEAIAREMGELLRRTSLSTNVKERLDFSCGLLDPEGELVVNAPHIPVHLGALGLCVRSVADALPLGPGDVAVTNSPAYGGSHLPDVTVITPVHLEANGESNLLGYVASRAHHAEIGGSRPGSMPPSARTLAEEGVVIEPMLLAAGGPEGSRPRWDAIREVLAGGPYPSRAVEENLADLAAALAAGHRGAESLRQLARRHGRETMAEQMRILSRRAGDRLSEALRRWGDGVYEAEERLDDGAPIAVSIEVADGRARISFAGSAPVHPGNLNATPAVVRSAVLYVLRLLVSATAARRQEGEAPLPLNEGLLRPVELELPTGMLSPEFPDDPRAAPAVVGGNTETSQRVVDTLIRALRIAAGSQGTMNNTLFGNERFGYYETVCGGCGATADRDGASAVHSHMTNTRATDPEVLERRYPVRLERFAVRRGSGGAGRRRGGDGALREITFLEPLSLSMVTQHRRERPFGIDGGEPGAPGRQRLFRAGGPDRDRVEELPPVGGCEVAPGDRLVLETPGGGGWGTP
jgi:5-oxoprolinase (ATP-hydrolysing)